MELSKGLIHIIAGTNPGNFGIYQVVGGGLRTVEHSPGLAGISGMTEEDYQARAGEDVTAIIHESDRPEVRRLTAQMVRDGRDRDFTYRIAHSTRDYVWIHAKSRVIGTLDGLPVIMAVFSNTSGETEEHDFLLAHSVTYIYVIDQSSREVLFANRPAMGFWGIDDFSRKTCYQCVAGRSTPCPWCAVPQMKQGYFRSELQLPGSEKRWIRVTYRAMRWRGRDAVAVFAVDITEERRRQDHLDFSRRSLEFIVDNIPVGVAVCTINEGKVKAVVINQKLGEHLGIDVDEFVYDDQAMVDGVHPHDRARVVRTMLQSGKPGYAARQDFEYRRPGKSDYSWLRMIVKSIDRNGEIMVFTSIIDVTAERKAEARIQKSRQMYRAVADANHMILWEYDTRDHHVQMMMDNDFTRSECKKYGLSGRIENGPEKMAKVLDPPYAQALLAMFRKMDEGAPMASCEAGYQSPDAGGMVFRRVTCTRLGGSGEDYHTVYGFAQDITAWKLASLRSGSLYNDPEAIGSFRHNLSQNAVVEGQVKESLLGRRKRYPTFDAFIHGCAGRMADPGIRGDFLGRYSCRQLLERFLKGSDHESFDYPMTLDDGRTRWYRSYIYMYQNPETGDVEAVTYAMDISDKHRDALVRNCILDTGFDFIALIHMADQTIEFLEKAGRFQRVDDFAGADYGDCRAHQRDHYVVAEDRARFEEKTGLGAAVRALEAQGRHTVVVRVRTEGRVSCHQLGYRWLDPGHGDILLTSMDITAAYEREQKQLMAVREAAERAEKANAAKTEFLSRISHDIRTPLNAIKGMTAFAREDIHDPEKLRDELDKIELSNEFLLSLINDVLDISKVDSGKIELHPVPCDHGDFARRMGSIFEPMCREKGIRLSFDLEPMPPVMVDSVRFNQIIFNVISNAFKYTPRGGAIAYSARSAALKGEGVECIFTIRDTGIGMSEAFAARVFEPFAQEMDHPLRQEGTPGTGLGMTIVSRLVGLMGGIITVRSKQGAGTTVTLMFTFPRADDDAMKREARPAPTLADLAGSLSGRVLMAEDNPINREITVRLLGKFGLEVDTACDGVEAVERFAASGEGQYRAILMDIQMPRMDGCAATGAIRSLPRADAGSVPIIALTADIFGEAIKRFEANGMDAYVSKPIEPAELHEALREAFERACVQ